jgi:hypothetical protein
MSFPGRTLHACQIAFEEMRKSMPQQPGLTRPHPSSTPYVNIAPAIPPTRSISESDPLLATRRTLQPLLAAPIRATESPHPPVTNGESPGYLRTTLQDGPEQSKKRGRPTKAEVAEREKAYAERGQTYQPKKRSTKRMRPSMGPDSLSLKDEDTTTSLLQTPQTPITTPLEETSSGRRRSRRQPQTISPIRIPSAGADLSRQESEQWHEHEHGPGQELRQEPEVNVAESPSDRILAGYRDRGSVASSLSRRTQQESDTIDQGQIESDLPT